MACRVAKVGTQATRSVTPHTPRADVQGSGKQQPIRAAACSGAAAQISPRSRHQSKDLSFSKARQRGFCCCERTLRFEHFWRSVSSQQGGVKRDHAAFDRTARTSHGTFSHSKRIVAPQAIGGSPNPRRAQLDVPNTLPEVEIVTRDGVIRRNVQAKKEQPPPESSAASAEAEETAAQGGFAPPGGLAEAFARQQEEAGRAQLRGMMNKVEKDWEGASVSRDDSQEGNSAPSEEEVDPVKARLAAMKRKAAEYKAAKGSGRRETPASVESSKPQSPANAAPEETPGASEKEEPKVDPVRARLEAMKKKAREYKTAQTAPSAPAEPATPTPTPAPQNNETSEGGSLGSEVALLLSQRRRQEPSAYANIIKPLERPSEENMPEIEILVGNEGNVGPSQRVQELQEEEYKPKVSTWGVFPRPRNISQAYGGGRTIRPGEPLLSEEERAAADKKTMDLLAAYKKKMGIEMDPDVKAKAEKALAKGEALLKRGALRESLVFFDEVMQDTPFRTEVHGLAQLNAALAWDSLGDIAAAKPLYEKLRQHPKAYIQRKANQMLFGFQAAEKLKFSKSSINFHDPAVFRKYLNGFSNGYDNSYAPSKEEIERSARDAATSQIFALAMVGAPLVLIGALIVSKGMT